MRYLALVLALVLLSGCATMKTLKQMQLERDKAIKETKVLKKVLDSQIKAKDNTIGGLQTKIESGARRERKYIAQINDLISARADASRVKDTQIRSYVVVKGDCLWNIAKKKIIYGDPWEWPKIYMANEDKIIDPHWIYPEQRFLIPR